jgi:hypothetical protein
MKWKTSGKMFLSKNPENVLENRETSLPISRFYD